MIDVVFPRKGELTFVPKGYQQLDKFFVWAGYDTSSGWLFEEVDVFLQLLRELAGSDFYA